MIIRTQKNAQAGTRNWHSTFLEQATMGLNHHAHLHCASLASRVAAQKVELVIWQHDGTR